MQDYIYGFSGTHVQSKNLVDIAHIAAHMTALLAVLTAACLPPRRSYDMVDSQLFQMVRVKHPPLLPAQDLSWCPKAVEVSKKAENSYSNLV